MRIILLCGGDGKRLWPLSNELLPKQYVKVLPRSTGEPMSMVQRIWEQLTARFPLQQVYAVVPHSQQSLLQEQIGPHIRPMIEPSTRDTFPAIAMACQYLREVERVSDDEVVVIVPVDAYVEAQFYDLFPRLERLVRSGESDLALIGVKPKFAADKYGYIIPKAADSETSSLAVGGFIEKPDRETAAALIEEGALWNVGVFAFQIGYMQQFLERSGFPTRYELTFSEYASLPRISFDYMVVEREKNLRCLPFDGVWTDLGTWNELIRVFVPEENERVILDDHSADTFVLNELQIPIIVSGIPNAVIAASPEGILICDRNMSHKIKSLLERLPKVR